MKNTSEVLKLEKLILKHKDLYYKGKPEISDQDYDQLEEQLKSLNPDSFVLSQVGSQVFDTEKVSHNTKMLSLAKTYKKDELLKWSQDRELVVTFKIDGSSCSLLYKDGEFHLAKTRGNGKFGENISQKALFIDSIPKKLKAYNGELEVRGEIYCTQENFEKLSQKMQEQGLEKPNSLRNIVAGLLGRKENIDLASYLSFQAFELIRDNETLGSEFEKMELLKEIGFITPDYKKLSTNSQIEKVLEQAQLFMNEGNYLIDGLVFTLDDMRLHKELGETAHHPRYKMAYKFAGETKETHIESISWQVSRNGILTPVANLEPVELSGAMVSRVTLHNYGVVKSFGLKEKDKIRLIRSGEVIPKFLELVERSSEDYKVPSDCPSCGNKIVEEDIRLLCVNLECPARVKDEILNFIKKIGIENLSSKRLEEMIKVGLIKNIPDLYKVTYEQFLSLDKVKDKLAHTFITQINDSKKTNLTTFLSSLGLSGGAYNKCEKIVKAGYDTLEKVMGLDVEKLSEIESFAQKSSSELIKSLENKKTMIDELIELGFTFEENDLEIGSSLKKQKFCITGTLSMKRSALEKIIKDAGGEVSSSVSKNTDFLVTNDTQSSSSKFKKAQSLEIPIINEEKLFEKINGKN